MKLTALPFQAMGTQPPFSPEDLERFVAAPRIALLSYVKRDGTPAQAPIWYPIPRRPPRDPGRNAAYRAVIVDGEVTLTDVAVEGGLNSWLAMHYFGRIGGREYEKMTAEENRKTGLSLISFDPVRVRGFDNHRLGG